MRRDGEEEGKKGLALRLDWAAQVAPLRTDRSDMSPQITQTTERLASFSCQARARYSLVDDLVVAHFE